MTPTAFFSITIIIVTTIETGNPNWIIHIDLKLLLLGWASKRTCREGLGNLKFKGAAGTPKGTMSVIV